MQMTQTLRSKTWSLVVLGAVLASIALAGCGSGGGDDTATNSSNGAGGAMSSNTTSSSGSSGG